MQIFVEDGQIVIEADRADDKVEVTGSHVYLTMTIDEARAVAGDLMTASA